LQERREKPPQVGKKKRDEEGKKKGSFIGEVSQKKGLSKEKKLQRSGRNGKSKGDQRPVTDIDA